MDLTEFVNNIVDVDALTLIKKIDKDLRLDWQENYKIYTVYRSRSFDKAYSLLKYIDNTFRKFDVLPSFSHFDYYKSEHLSNDELLSGLWVLVLVYRAVTTTDINKIKQCRVVDTIETINIGNKMNVIKIKYFGENIDTEVETEGEDDEYEGE